MNIVDITPTNVEAQGLFCIKDPKSPGFKQKLKWFQKRFKEGLKLKLIKNSDDATAGFIEYIPAEYAWRPIVAPNYYFIHCIMVYPNKNKHQGYGSLLVQSCMQDAQENDKDGVAVMTSKGPWMSGKELFSKNSFQVVGKKGRFELMSQAFKKSPQPAFIDWEKGTKSYSGWHLIYSDQCPWHDKAALVLTDIANDHNISLAINKIQSAREAQTAPSGYGTFALIKDGKVLSDHYISATRFKNIIQQQRV